MGKRIQGVFGAWYFMDKRIFSEGFLYVLFIFFYLVHWGEGRML